MRASVFHRGAAMLRFGAAPVSTTFPPRPHAGPSSDAAGDPRGRVSPIRSTRDQNSRVSETHVPYLEDVDQRLQLGFLVTQHRAPALGVIPAVQPGDRAGALHQRLLDVASDQ